MKFCIPLNLRCCVVLERHEHFRILDHKMGLSVVPLCIHLDVHIVYPLSAYKLSSSSINLTIPVSALRKLKFPKKNETRILNMACILRLEWESSTNPLLTIGINECCKLPFIKRTKFNEQKFNCIGITIDHIVSSYLDLLVLIEFLCRWIIFLIWVLQYWPPWTYITFSAYSQQIFDILKLWITARILGFKAMLALKLLVLKLVGLVTWASLDYRLSIMDWRQLHSIRATWWWSCTMH